MFLNLYHGNGFTLLVYSFLISHRNIRVFPKTYLSLNLVNLINITEADSVEWQDIRFPRDHPIKSIECWIMVIVSKLMTLVLSLPMVICQLSCKSIPAYVNCQQQDESHFATNLFNCLLFVRKEQREISNKRILWKIWLPQFTWNGKLDLFSHVQWDICKQVES